MGTAPPALSPEPPGLVPARARPGAISPPDGDDPVAAIAARLAAGELFTAIAADLAGEEIYAAVIREPAATLNRAEERWLMAPGVRVMRRRGELRTARTGHLAARVTSLVIPSRVPADVLAELGDTAIPLGAVIARLGGRREPLWQHPYCGPDVVLHSCARLWLRGRPAGLAAEAVARLDWWAR